MSLKIIFWGHPVANSVTEYYFNFSKIEYWYGKVIHIENMISFKNVYNISCQTSKTVPFLDESLFITIAQQLTCI